MLYCLLLSFFGYTSANVTYYLDGQPKRNPPEFRGLLSVNELAAAGGYPATNFEVITEDGYSLWLFRLGSNPGPPVLMQHGIAVASDQWITRGPGRDLAFILLDKGYDVWLSNRRGTVFNEYSRRYSKSDPRFWKFSFHEVGYYDLPALIDTVLDVRKKDKIFFIGHSLGTTEFFVMGAARPEYCGKVRAAVLLSPVAYPPSVTELPPALRLLQRSFNYLYRNLKATGVYELSPRTEESIANTKELCINNDNTKTVCLDVVGSISGEHRTNINIDEWEFFVPYYGAGDSALTLFHITQVYISGEFKQLDQGPVENLRRYGSIRPPRYKLNLITTPVALFWGHNDILTSEVSVKRIASDLPNLILSKPVPDPKFNHIDMYLGDNTNEVLNPYIIEVLDNFSRRESQFHTEEESNVRREPHRKGKDEFHSYVGGEPHLQHEGGLSHGKLKEAFHSHKEDKLNSNNKEKNPSSNEEAHSDHDLNSDDDDDDDDEKPCPCNEEEETSSTKQESQLDTRKA